MRVLSSAAVVVVGLSCAAQAGDGGRVVVAFDEWTLSNSGFNQAPTTGFFVENLVEYFGGPGDFIAISTNFGVSEQSLSDAIAATGSSWEVVGAVPDLDVLLTYDAIFVGGNPGVDFDDLVAFTQAGGHIYVFAGTGHLGGAAGEAATWNPFLETVGLAYQPFYNGVGGVQNTTGVNHPLFDGVSGLYGNNGSSIIDLNPNDDVGEIVVFQAGTDVGLFAVSEAGGCQADCNTDGALNILDFVCFQGEWQNQSPVGDCDANGQYNILDFVCFQGEFVAGCD